MFMKESKVVLDRICENDVWGRRKSLRWLWIQIVGSRRWLYQSWHRGWRHCGLSAWPKALQSNRLTGDWDSKAKWISQNWNVHTWQKQLRQSITPSLQLQILSKVNWSFYWSWNFDCLKFRYFPLMMSRQSLPLTTIRFPISRLTRALPGGKLPFGVEIELNSAIIDLEEEVPLDVTNLGERNSRWIKQFYETDFSASIAASNLDSVHQRIGL